MHPTTVFRCARFSIFSLQEELQNIVSGLRDTDHNLRVNVRKKYQLAAH